MLADRLLKDIWADIEAGQPIDLGDLRAYEVFADRGGYLAADRLAVAEAARGRLVLEALTLETLSPEQRNILIQRWRDHENEALGRVEPAEDSSLTPAIAQETTPKG